MSFLDVACPACGAQPYELCHPPANVEPNRYRSSFAAFDGTTHLARHRVDKDHQVVRRGARPSYRWGTDWAWLLAVECWSCRQPAGQPCVTFNGLPTGPHSCRAHQAKAQEART